MGRRASTEITIQTHLFSIPIGGLDPNGKPSLGMMLLRRLKRQAALERIRRACMRSKSSITKSEMLNLYADMALLLDRSCDDDKDFTCRDCNDVDIRTTEVHIMNMAVNLYRPEPAPKKEKPIWTTTVRDPDVLGRDARYADRVPVDAIRPGRVPEAYAEVVRYGRDHAGVLLTGPDGKKLVAPLQHAEAHVLADQLKETSDEVEYAQRIYDPSR